MLARYLSRATILGLLCAIPVIDIVTGSEVRIFPFYFVVITLAASRFSRRFALTVAGLSTVFWLGSKFLDGTVYSSLGIWFWNTLMQGAGFLYVAILVSKLNLLQQAENLSARTDLLTGLHNRKGFQEQAGLLLAVCKRERRPLVMAYIDLDHFKKVNDSQGHARGDEVLRLAARSMRSSLRTIDLIGRVGGDEFAVLLPFSDAAHTFVALDRMRLAIQQDMQANGCDVTASIGAVAYRSAPDDIATLNARADSVMYEVKQSGRNQVKIIESA